MSWSTWPDPWENCHLNVKKLPKKLYIFFKKIDKKWQILSIFLKKFQAFGNFLTFKWQFFGGSDQHKPRRSTILPEVSGWDKSGICWDKISQHFWTPKRLTFLKIVIWMSKNCQNLTLKKKIDKNCHFFNIIANGNFFF